MNENSKRNVEKIVGALEEKKAIDISVIDLEHKTTLADAFVIATGNSDVHMATLVRVVDETFDSLGVQPRIEGERSTQWALIDGGDIIVHIFGAKAREFYSLERIWKNFSALREAEESEQ